MQTIGDARMSCRSHDEAADEAEDVAEGDRICGVDLSRVFAGQSE